MNGDPAAAHYHRVLDPLAVLPRRDEELPQLLRRAGDADEVARFEGEIAVGYDGFAAALDDADKDFGAEAADHILELHPVKLAVRQYAVLDYLGAALGKGVDPYRARKAEDAGYLLCALKLRVHDDGKTQRLAQELRLLHVPGVADTGDDVLRAELARGNAADHVHLIAAHGGHDEVGIRRAGFGQRFGVRGAALDADNVEVI